MKVKTYSFFGNKPITRSWESSPLIKYIRDEIITKLGIRPNFVLVNLYRDGEDYIGYHSDSENNLDQCYPILGVTFGAVRPFRLRDKTTQETYEVLLENGSCVGMFPLCQSKYKHSVPKSKKVKTGRISLPFRVIK
jgi:alkylated DNA repair dioxygenase AlkB